MTSPEAGSGAQPGAVRLIFEYEGDVVRLVAQQRVDMAVAGFNLTPELRPGRYIEVRSAADEGLGLVPVREDFGASTEVFPEQPGEPITRVEVREPRGAFTVVVPAPETAARVSLVDVLPGEPGAPVPAAPATSQTSGEPRKVEVASFDLDLDAESK
jgi:hypothetical protein